MDVSDFGGNLDSTQRQGASTLPGRVLTVLSRTVAVCALPMDFQGKLRILRTMFMRAALHGVVASLGSQSQEQIAVLVLDFPQDQFVERIQEVGMVPRCCSSWWFIATCTCRRVSGGYNSGDAAGAALCCSLGRDAVVPRCSFSQQWSSL